MSKIIDLQERIESLERDLQKAEAGYAAARSAMASNMNNDDARKQLRVFAEHRTVAREEIAIMQEELAKVIAAANSPERLRLKQEATEHFQNTQRMAQDRDGAAAAIDAALDALAVAVKQWVDVNETYRTEISHFYRKTFVDDIRNLITFAPDAIGPAHAVSNAIAAQLSRALTGIQVDRVLAFNHVEHHDRLERAAVDSAASADTIKWRMLSVAEPEAAQE